MDNVYPPINPPLGNAVVHAFSQYSECLQLTIIGQKTAPRKAVAVQLTRCVSATDY